jgi:hypothetical protein
MSNVKRILMVSLALVLLLTGAGVFAQPAQAANCSYYHVVSWGQSLSWIGRYYGVSWRYLAQINNIPNPSKIYAGQRLCIAYGGGTGGYPAPSGWVAGWDYKVTKVVQDATVNIRTYNMPSNVMFEIFIGRTGANGQYEWDSVSQLDSDRGGSFNVRDIPIPASYQGTARMFVRLVQAKKGTTVDRWFNNYSTATSGGAGTGGYPPPYPGYWGIPTIWIIGVQRDNSVTFRTHNFPPGLDFDVLMGPMGARGYGYYVDTFNSGAGGVMDKTSLTPPALYGSHQISIRTQNLYTGYYSYNWFYNYNYP